MFSLLASVALVVNLATPASDSAQLRREELMAKLHNGGYSVLLRHARTDYSVQEPMGTVPVERSAQRNLSDDGIRDAALMGVVFRKYGISFAEIISSPMFRAVETAEMAAGKPTTTMALRVFPSTPEQEQIVKTAPKPGTNRLIVTHHFVIEKFVPGITPGAVAESEAAVVSHEPNGDLRLVGIIKLDDWKALANPGSGASAASGQSGTLVHSAPAAAVTHTGTAVAIPNSAAGHLAHGYISAFNSGDANAMRTFIQSSLVANPQRPVEERVKTYLKSFDDFGPLALVSLDSATATQVTLGVRSKRGALSLTVRTSDTDPQRAASVTISALGAHH